MVIAASSLGSSNTMFGDLTLSLRVTGINFLAASSPIIFPVRTEPVNAIFARLGCQTRAAPTSSPKSVTTFNTPAGRPTSDPNLASFKAVRLEYSLGFSTTVFPATNAGATLRAA
ncbi:MAG: hypothetical protein ACI90U_002235 [Pseudomonadales bacterium]|jgi:hypothetical protein